MLTAFLCFVFTLANSPSLWVSIWTLRSARCYSGSPNKSAVLEGELSLPVSPAAPARWFKRLSSLRNDDPSPAITSPWFLTYRADCLTCETYISIIWPITQLFKSQAEVKIKWKRRRVGGGGDEGGREEARRRNKGRGSCLRRRETGRQTCNREKTQEVHRYKRSNSEWKRNILFRIIGEPNWNVYLIINFPVILSVTLAWLHRTEHNKYHTERLFHRPDRFTREDPKLCRV